MNTIILYMLVCLNGWVMGYPEYHDGTYEEPLKAVFDDKQRVIVENEELTSDYWINMAKKRIILQRERIINKNVAKNVILFMGDGMSIATQTATRAYLGQMKGESGEEVELSFEKFPISGLVKTYCLNAQVADSACTATAYLGGVKANYGTIGVNGKVPNKSCEKMRDKSNHVESLAKILLDAGKSVGVVTTTSIVDASPAGIFGHTAERLWHNDGDIIKDGHDPELCKDLAYQLVHGETGKRIKVILGGGRSEFLSNQTTDEEGYMGNRWDGKNLIQEWVTQKSDSGRVGSYVWNKNQLLGINSSTDFLLGLFEPIHCQYNLEANKSTEPSLTEMLEVAIKLLSQNDKGYFLFAEGGRIDHGHHNTMARLALDETAEFSKAINRAVELTSNKDTLLVVTSDHAHTMSLSGYSTRGNNILGVADETKGKDDIPYMTISYTNGPGYRREFNGKRADVTKENIEKIRFEYPSLVPMKKETHGGDDVGIYAYGPWEHLFTGVYEQSSIPHIIKYATSVDKNFSPCSVANKISSIITLPIVAIIFGYLLTN